MIKITFEISEEFLKKNSDLDSVTEKIKSNERDALSALFDNIGFRQLETQVDKGKTEFIITPDKLDKKSSELYDLEIAKICMLAAFSETDNKKQE
jgi:hypothetical protein